MTADRSAEKAGRPRTARLGTQAATNLPTTTGLAVFQSDGGSPTSPDPKTRVRAIHHLAAGVEALERQVLLDAQSSGLAWAQIGEVYGVSRQAAHRRFSDETIVPSDFFDHLLEDLDEDGEVAPNLARAAKRLRRAASA